MKQMKLPPPGSDAAIAMSCSCPVLDNAHGHGYMGQQGIYVFSGNCPLHVIGTQVDITADPNDDNDLNEPLGAAACNLDGECESCQ
jgi:hypothetical protein